MQYSNIIDVLMEEFPELASRYEEDKDYLEGLQYLVFEIIFTQHLIKLLKSESEKDQVIKMFNFIEKMSTCKDEKVKDIAGVSILESLIIERKSIKNLQSYLGEETKEEFCRLLKFYE
jgi:hypothetical protein